ncbi:MAG: transposase [Fimbriimonadaceae bacterium]|nr:transposase [Fimbriimonadaceae bacterium]
MPRRLRNAEGGLVYHVLNRAVAHLPLFQTEFDYTAFETVLQRALERQPLRLLSYCVMPNHWHLVVWPETDGALSQFVGWLSKTHVQRWHTAHGTIGQGPLYQSRFKSFPVQDDEYLLTVCRYVERNPLRAGLVPQAQDWQWSSLWRRLSDHDADRAWLTSWPVSPPTDSPDWINEPLSDRELDALRRCAQRGGPFGDPTWVASTAQRLGLTSALRDRGRPRRTAEKGS